MLYIDEEPDIDDRPRGYCVACQCWTDAKRVDFGIGAYEYWGCKGVHHDWQEVCPECEGELLDEEPISEEE
jgi:hypothetical protein